MKSFVFTLLIVGLIGLTAHSQTLQVSGVVRDSLSKPLGFASVIIYKGSLSRVVGFGTSNADGFYELSFKVDTSHYFLTVNMLGYAKSTQEININPNSPAKIVKNFTLKEQTLELNTVVVNSGQMVKQKGDTTTYNVDAIKNDSERTLEDMLKKLPGVSVAGDGAVLVNGKEIKSLLIEGEDIFQENYKVGTRNIPIGVIDQIQAIDNHESKSQLKGISNSNDMVLNITLKKDRKTILFGDIEAKYGLEDRRQIHSNLFSIQPKNKLYLIAEHNNIGIAPLDLLTKSNSKVGNTTVNSSLSTLIDIPASNLNNTDLSNERANLNQANFVYLSGISTLSKKIKLNHTNLFINDKNTFLRIAQSESQLGEDNFRTEERQNSIFKPNVFNSRLALAYDISPKARLDLSSEWKSEWKDYENNIEFQIELPDISLPFDNTLENMKSSSNQWLNNLNYTLRLDTNQALIADFYHVFQDNPQEYQANSTRFAPLFSLDNEFNILEQDIGFKNQRLGGNATYLLKGREAKYNFQIGSEYAVNNLDSDVEISSENETNRIGEGFRNQLRYITYNHFMEGSFSRKILKDFRFTASVRLLHLGFEVESSLNDTRSKASQVTFLEPTLTLVIPVGEANLIANYQFKRSLPTIREVAQGTIFYNYRSLQQGSESLIFPKSHTFVLSYFWLAPNYNLALNTSLVYLYAPENYGFGMEIDPFFSKTRQIIVNGNQNLIYMMNFDKYLSPISSALKLGVNLTWISINSQLGTDIPTENTYFVQEYALTYRSLFNGFFNAEAKIEYTLNRNQNENGSETFSNQSLFNQISTKLIFQPKSKKCQLILNAERMTLDNEGEKVFDYYFIDGEFLYHLIDKKLEIGLMMRNLLNNNEFSRVRFDNFFVSQQSQNIIPRLFLLSLKFSF